MQKNIQDNKQNKNFSTFISLLFNIVIPSLVLTYLSGENKLGPVYALILGLAFPFCFGLYTLIASNKFSYLALLGIISIGLTGGMSLMELDAHWLAVKEASIPLILAIFTLVSVSIKKPMIKTLFFRPEIINVKLMESILLDKGCEKLFEKIVSQATIILAISFFMSSALNYGLAKYLLQGVPGTDAFNQDLGKMTALSIPIIAVPTSIVIIFIFLHISRGFKKLTGISMDDILNRSH